MLQPAIYVTMVGVVVGPMNDSAFGVPFVFSVEAHCIPLAKTIDSWCEVDVVRNEYSLT